jgi:hypothetical protein
MKKVLVCLAVLALATAAFGQNTPELNDHGNGNGHGMEVQGWAKPGGSGASNISYHGGPVLHSARVVLIFWGVFPSGYTTAIANFRNQFGTTGEFNTITQYSDGGGNIQLTNLAGGTPDMFDTSTPPTNVTDSAVQGEVLKYLNSGHAFDASTIYEVFIPSGSYSSDGTSTSCGGPNLSYCAYHGHFSNGGRDIKYSIQPWAGCSGCSSFGNTTLDQDHFVCHETREAVTDPDLNAWYDRRGSEADDKCAWTPAPFIGTGGFGYQYEWSNANSGCVKTR